MGLPIRWAQLVFDQRICGGFIRNTQHRLGKTHQHQPFVGIQAVLLKQLVDGVDGGVHVANVAHQRCRVGLNARKIVLVGVEQFNQLADVGIFIDDIVFADTLH